ncbi:flagellar motor protein MotB [Clostridium estertheticum]|uniref:Chemotaxis protein MotB n=1 Tax=Clostridium estertheticum TaxID=238834 RepID=A0A5N7IKJ5_9CLOT|nr:flagellar motor protein MotB [Clostridium estertheticum]MBU3170702.1 OmpA family protein [Clostridium estertheticum]MBX4264726.1 OmpA family protein [Clostridium estertheticum]MBX4269774.1 OmpA family protein [Clostridium estertheticum]MCB2339346.1 OmpA family protein [Clostridium estertheticum]MCB2352812.1 OmpA family protein [Clostridium estertheticum]
MKKREEKEGNGERWLLTYSDLITLLMIFFVVMYASSTADTTKYKQLAKSLNVAISGGGASIIGSDTATSVTNSTVTVVDPPETTTNAANSKTAEENNMENIKKNVDTYLKQNGLASSVSTKIDERGLEVSLKTSLLFDVGTAGVKEDSAKKLISIGKILNHVNNYVRIEGHTDSTPMSNNEFKSNWQLSAIRATNVTELLISKAGISPKKISAVAYGENRPVATNTTEVGKAKNRTVDIIILSNQFSKTEKIK